MDKSTLHLKSPWQTLAFAFSAAPLYVAAQWIFAIAGNILTYLLPYFYKLIADQLTNTQVVSFHLIRVPLIWIIGIFIGQEVLFRIGHALEVYGSTNTFRKITVSLYENVIKRPTSYFEDKFSGDLGRRIQQVSSSAVYFVEDFPWSISWIIVALIMAGILLATVSWYLFAVFLIWLALFVITSIPLLIWEYRSAEDVATQQAALSGSVVDVIANIPVVHAFGAVPYEQVLHVDKTNKVVAVERKVRWVGVLNKLQQGISLAVIGISITVVSIWLAEKGLLSIGDFVLVAAVIPSFIGVVWNFGDTVIRSSRQLGELSDAVQKLRVQQEQLQGGSTTDLPRETGINFEDVQFQYAGTAEPVFAEFSLQIPQGQNVGIVGSSGAGKTTLMKLLLRQYAFQSGDISIGGTSIQEFSLPTLRKLVAYVPQDTSLFHRTLIENIHYARKDATPEEVIVASKKAKADEFIEALPQGYETMVGERGIKLSGGQRQRIAIARAILKNAPILVLDEATSALDSESEMSVQEGLAELFKSRTVIAIAHRLSTLRKMDRVVVMEEGKIVEDGSPNELLDKPMGAFKRMWEHQRNGFI